LVTGAPIRSRKVARIGRLTVSDWARGGLPPQCRPDRVGGARLHSKGVIDLNDRLCCVRSPCPPCATSKRNQRSAPMLQATRWATCPAVSERVPNGVIARGEV